MAKRKEAPLGTGMAERARKAMKDRKKKLDDILDKSSKNRSASDVLLG